MAGLLVAYNAPAPSIIDTVKARSRTARQENAVCGSAVKGEFDVQIARTTTFGIATGGPFLLGTTDVPRCAIRGGAAFFDTVSQS